MFLKTVALTVAIAGLGTTLVMGVANAATPTGATPICSRTVTDHCMTPSHAPKASHHGTPVHHATKVATQTTHKAAPRKG